MVLRPRNEKTRVISFTIVCVCAHSCLCVCVCVAPNRPEQNYTDLPALGLVPRVGLELQWEP